MGITYVHMSARAYVYTYTTPALSVPHDSKFGRLNAGFAFANQAFVVRLWIPQLFVTIVSCCLASSLNLKVPFYCIHIFFVVIKLNYLSVHLL